MSKFTPFDLPQKIFDNHQVVGHVVLGEKARIEVAVVSKDSIVSVKLAQQYRNKSLEWKHGIKSISMPIRRVVEGEVIEPMIELATLLQSLTGMADTFELHDPENEVWVPRRPTEEELVEILNAKSTKNKYKRGKMYDEHNARAAASDPGFIVRKAQDPGSTT